MPLSFCFNFRWEVVDCHRLWAEESVHLLVSHRCMKTTGTRPSSRRFSISLGHRLNPLIMSPWIKLCISYICVFPHPLRDSLFVAAVTSWDRKEINTGLNLDKTLMIIFHLCIQSSLYRLGSQVKTICYNLVPGKCKSIFQRRWNKNHAVHYILYS